MIDLVTAETTIAILPIDERRALTAQIRAHAAENDSVKLDLSALGGWSVIRNPGF